MEITNMHNPGEQKTYLPPEGNYLRYLPPKFSECPIRPGP
jgi:hypothetical protein